MAISYQLHSSNGWPEQFMSALLHTFCEQVKYAYWPYEKYEVEGATCTTRIQHNASNSRTQVHCFLQHCLLTKGF
jgi:hypothetical protein